MFESAKLLPPSVSALEWYKSHAYTLFYCELFKLWTYYMSLYHLGCFGMAFKTLNALVEDGSKSMSMPLRTFSDPESVYFGVI